MSTIPLIFNEKKIPHTVIGGAVKKSDEEQSNFSLILLNRGGRYYRSSVFQSLEISGFDSVISIEIGSQDYEVESLSSKFPYIKFLVPMEEITVGEMINLGIAESNSNYVLVVWNDIGGLNIKTIQNQIKKIQKNDLLCISPVLQNHRMEQLPVQMVPALKDKIFSVEPISCFKEMVSTLYPYDYVGIYNREKVIQLGGFDHTITSYYWQNVDFGMRAYLWGEKIFATNSFRLKYEGNIPSEDITAESSYLRFFLKNLAPVFKEDHAVLPSSKFFSFYKNSGLNIVESFKQFSKAKKWVKRNKYRYKYDASFIVSQWEPDI